MSVPINPYMEFAVIFRALCLQSMDALRVDLHLASLMHLLASFLSLTRYLHSSGMIPLCFVLNLNSVSPSSAFSLMETYSPSENSPHLSLGMYVV